MKQALLVAIPLCLGCAVASAQVGNITFETSASPQAQEHFLRGVAILHSFGFVDAIEEFQKAQELDPDFALAYWGEATAHNGNPLRSPTGQDLPAARNALKKLGGTREERIAKARSEKEKMWMEAVEILYGAGDKESRDWAYAEAMSKIVDAYPGDEEARAFYALALLGTVRRAGNDFRQQMTAAAVAQGLLRQTRATRARRTTSSTLSTIRCTPRSPSMQRIVMRKSHPTSSTRSICRRTSSYSSGFGRRS